MWLLVKLILLQKYYIYAVLAHNGGNKGINVLVISCAIGAKSAIERDWPQPTCGQSPLTGSVFHGAI